MARQEIIEKLDKFLSTHLPLNEEHLAVYLLVELRKVLSHRNPDQKFKLIEFYADWTVHTSKDRKMNAITAISERIRDVLYSNPRPSNSEYDEVLNFLRMPELRKELIELFTMEGLSLDLMNDSNWPVFVKSLARVLSGQPINNPITEIKRIELTADDNGSLVTVDFNNGTSHDIGMSLEMY